MTVNLYKSIIFPIIFIVTVIIMVSNEMYELGAKSSVIREIFEFGKKRAAEIGRENV